MEVRVIQYLEGDNINEVREWFGEDSANYFNFSTIWNEHFVITLKGSVRVKQGDYIVQHAEGNYVVANQRDLGKLLAKETNRKNESIEKSFTYHSPKEGPEKYNKIRKAFKELAYLIDEEVPNSREKSVAMTNLETANFWANAGIARNL
jgi:hypothetical protein